MPSFHTGLSRGAVFRSSCSTLAVRANSVQSCREWTSDPPALVRVRTILRVLPFVFIRGWLEGPWECCQVDPVYYRHVCRSVSFYFRMNNLLIILESSSSASLEKTCSRLVLPWSLPVEPQCPSLVVVIAARQAGRHCSILYFPKYWYIFTK